MRYTTRPLSGWDGPRTPADRRRSRYQFRAGWQSTLDLLERELSHLKARDVVLEADFREQDLRLDGMPRSNARQPLDPAVRIAFDSKHGPLLYQCDSYDGWQENVRAIALGLEALRAVDRYGITRRAEQYTGWRQIGAGPAIVTDPPMDRHRAAEVVVRWAYPGVSAVAMTEGLLTGSLDLAPIARRAQRHAHPDSGERGSAEFFDLVQRAIKILRGAQ